MHPAYSIIFFTTASGAGYGLLALLGVLAAAGLVRPDLGLGLAAFVLGLGLVTGGLLSSTFHLGHPERAWRAFSQWRSSWLSREGVLAVATYVPVLLFAFGWLVLARTDGLWALFGLLGAAGAVATVYCTAMIYRSLAAIPQWHQPLVPLGYLLLALASGAVWLNLLLTLFAVPVSSATLFAAAACIVAWRVKRIYWQRIDAAPKQSTTESATGLGDLGPVRLLDMPHTEANYLQQEMGFKVARKHALRLRSIAGWGGFVLPALLIASQMLLAQSWAGMLAALLAALLVSLGSVVERWLFFAEAQHKVSLFYGAKAV